MAIITNITLRIVLIYDFAHHSEMLTFLILGKL